MKTKQSPRERTNINSDDENQRGKNQIYVEDSRYEHIFGNKQGKKNKTNLITIKTKQSPRERTHLWLGGGGGSHPTRVEVQGSTGAAKAHWLGWLLRCEPCGAGRNTDQSARGQPTPAPAARFFSHLKSKTRMTSTREWDSRKRKGEHSPNKRQVLECPAVLTRLRLAAKARCDGAVRRLGLIATSGRAGKRRPKRCRLLAEHAWLLAEQTGLLLLRLLHGSRRRAARGNGEQTGSS